MIVKPKVKSFICTTAHPVGCRESVKRQIDYIKSLGTPNCEVKEPKKILVLGSSTGYGLASRIALAFGYHADTLGVMFERESNGRRTATAGMYNTRAFEEFAAAEGMYAKTINGDAFSSEIKEQTINMIKSDLGKIDMVVYSLAAPRRTTADGTTYQSVLKTVGAPFENKTINLEDNTVVAASIPCANEEEIQATIKVMGGEDWIDWMKVLSDAGVLSDDVTTLAYSYIGPELTFPIYRDGSIGQAKKDLYASCDKINEMFPNVKAYISVNKALVTQSSTAIPIVPLYISLLFKVMKEAGLHEGCIEQMGRLFLDRLCAIKPETDERGFLRLDDWEMREDIQNKVTEAWAKVDTDSLSQFADLDGFWDEFYNMFGFHYDNVDYEADVEIL